MDKLLHWSIAQQAGDKEALAKIGEPDPKLLNQLFGGPDEVALMKESIAIAHNPKVEDKDKEIALENFEMLIENMDNANNIENLGLWHPIVDLLKSDVPDDLRVTVSGIIGTAVQNNPKSQEDFAKTNGLQELITIAGDGQNKSLQNKALYAISSYIRNYKPGYKQFDESSGWDLVKLDSKDSKFDLRVLSLVSSILSNGLDNDIESRFKKSKLVHYLASVLNLDSNTNLVDKSLNIISELHRLRYNFSDEETFEVDRGIQVVEGLSDKINIDDLNRAKQVTKK
ncbi:Fes1 protein [Candida orthopsilosis Co 90-125]|uniref:Hsp70 nucleotide exchange factor FES1 n=1 Tax=Candida orthopsilosis (strain 90-125) TaxID=1136231 RepID=H8X9F1_CANO9|nr:Fes1 protein [Candida orthopsilosis Co 90-125]CCG24617.1 Fes1 protein [Candida orthopsilosis Co 90-125]